MNTYFAIFRIRFINALQYRAAAAAGIATQFAFGFMFILAFAAFYKVGPDAFPMEFSQTVSYIWMQQAFMALFFTWFWENDIAASIMEGSIAYEMVRPADLYSRWFCQAAANRLARAVLRCSPILVVAFVLPKPYRMSLPPDMPQFALFIISLALALGVVVAFSMLIVVTAFYTITSLGTRFMMMIIGDFLAGALIPLPFFPGTIRRIVELLPFASMSNMPLRIFSGDITGVDATNGIMLQVFWVFALVITGRILMNRALSKVIVQGG